MKVVFKALDTLVFRDGKPFGNGGDTWADSLMFPTPTTLYGALRGAYFSQNPDQLPKANTPEDPTKDLCIKGIYFCNLKEGGYLFPIPRDLVKTEQDSGEKITLLNLIPNVATSNPLPYIFTVFDECDKVENVEGFMGEWSFGDYINADISTLSPQNLYLYGNFVSIEPKIGIALDRGRRTAQEERLYRLAQYRYNGLGIVVDFEGIEIADYGVLKLGGEAKGARYEKFEGSFEAAGSLDGDMFKVVLLTPAIFSQGWIPDFVDPYTMEGKDIQVRLVAAAIGRAQYIGGWDMQKKFPKPMKKAVPPGSVYFFELIDKVDAKNILDRFSLRSIVADTSLQKEGYGICTVAKAQGVRQ